DRRPGGADDRPLLLDDRADGRQPRLPDVGARRCYGDLRTPNARRRADRRGGDAPHRAGQPARGVRRGHPDRGGAQPALTRTSSLVTRPVSPAISAAISYQRCARWGASTITVTVGTRRRA